MAALPIISAVIGAAGSVASGIAAKNQADFEAKQQEMAGNEAFASSQRDAEEKRKEAWLVQSRQQALAASSGAGATDPTIVQLMEDTAGQGEYNAQTAQYVGENRKRGLFDSAMGTRMTGQANMFGSFLSGASQLASGFAKYRTDQSILGGSGYGYG